MKIERPLKSVGWLGGSSYRTVINEAERRRRMPNDNVTTEELERRARVAYGAAAGAIYEGPLHAFCQGYATAALAQGAALAQARTALERLTLAFEEGAEHAKRHPVRIMEASQELAEMLAKDGRDALAAMGDPDAGLELRPEVEERLREPPGELLTTDEMRERLEVQDGE